MDAAPENKIRFGALFSLRSAILGFADRPLKKSVRDFFYNLVGRATLNPMAHKNRKASTGSTYKIDSIGS